MVVHRESNMKRILGEFCDVTNMHGMGHLAREHTGCCRRTIWIIITTAATVAVSVL